MVIYILSLWSLESDKPMKKVRETNEQNKTKI